MSKKQRRDIPQLGKPIFETHCHLDYLNPDDLSRELDAARVVGVTRFVTIAVSPDNLHTVRRIAQTYDDVYCTQGIHPHEAAGFSEAVGEQIADAAQESKVVAIGEIGLDYFYDHAERDVQRKTFARQLALAAQARLPVVIHSRDADEDMRAILREHLPDLSAGGVIHSFSSGLELAEFALESGFMLGFNGMVTFNRADNVRAAVAITPLDRLVLETDTPYLTPVPYRGKTNAPRYLPFVAEKVAEIKDLDTDSLLDHCYANSQTLFPGAGADQIS